MTPRAALNPPLTLYGRHRSTLTLCSVSVAGCLLVALLCRLENLPLPQPRHRQSRRRVPVLSGPATRRPRAAAAGTAADGRPSPARHLSLDTSAPHWTDRGRRISTRPGPSLTCRSTRASRRLPPPTRLASIPSRPWCRCPSSWPAGAGAAAGAVCSRRPVRQSAVRCRPWPCHTREVTARCGPARPARSSTCRRDHRQPVRAPAGRRVWSSCSVSPNRPAPTAESGRGRRQGQRTAAVNRRRPGHRELDWKDRVDSACSEERMDRASPLV